MTLLVGIKALELKLAASLSDRTLSIILNFSFPISSPMTSGKPKSSYVVRFAQTEADQDLLQAVDRALENQSYKSFSDLCKQALRLMLLSAEPPPTLPMLAVLEQQLMTLQLQMMQQEQRLMEPHSSLGRIEEQMQELSARLVQLEQKVDTAVLTPASEEPEPESETDPLLSRLAPLLEDF